MGQEYDPIKIESLHRVISVFQRLDKYFSDDTKTEIDKLVACIDGLTDDQQNYLVDIKEQIARLNRKFINAQRLGFDSLKDVDEVLEGLREHIIDVNLYPHLNSDSTREKADIVNDKIDELLVKAGKLQGCIVKQKKHIENLVKEHNDDINNFLRNAGFNYKVILDEDETGQYKLKLLDNEANLEVGNAKEHLSFGERNAFALVLFMYDALKKKPDLIILDDPISSFDKNKKYAIIDMLFSKGKAFRGKSVLMLTHDFEPLIDMLLHHTDRFELPFATFLENNNGELTEKIVMRNDVQTFIEITKANIDSDIHMINRLVYLRRLFEVTANKGCGYQLLSSLFHKRNTPTVREDSNEREMTADEIQSGHDEISKHIQGFDYKNLLLTVNDSNKMVQLYSASGNNYEKLHLYRILFDKDGGVESKIIRKFINEAFHLENDYIYQLNPSKYQLVPQYIIDECDKYIRSFD